MRTDLLLAGGLAALVIGGVVAVGRAARMREEADRVNAVAITEVVLLQTPRPDARATGFVAPGAAVIAERTGAPGWVYVTAPGSEGYALEKDFAFL